MRTTSDLLRPVLRATSDSSSSSSSGIFRLTVFIPGNTSLSYPYYTRSISFQCDLPDVGLRVVFDEEDGPAVAGRDSDLAQEQVPVEWGIEKRDSPSGSRVEEDELAMVRIRDDQPPAVAHPGRDAAEVGQSLVLLRLEPVQDDPGDLRSIPPRGNPGKRPAVR